MNAQKRDLILASKRVTEEEGNEMECECGELAAPFSCYCEECEKKLYSEG